ncbi:polyprenol monophosphomannose synthase [Agrococcus casei]|uniref:Dolichol-phosphate mannosyltransferase in lipid-linked oligosaccharide synthesis cluster n=1 Tax=Agrococcus casei LMG 22410 TaxID=1255656 RepID=A0A1R4F4Y8_9MICO|nr:polyprenol monophosphomannose synthase [Agrococcus casei]SJM50956.1 Dolichol-phosphate mannosyltransferase in lipid-linked oligosaccharide synthesis cluster [Agrococcus casei LMG 22410]
MPASRTVVMIPTFNEIESLERTVREVRQNAPEADVLVIDDNSPDGTGDLADRLAADDPAIRVMHRTEKAGLGAAYIAGMRVAMECGYEVAIEMDADGSHPAEALPALIAAAQTNDLVIGSRYMPGGATEGWARDREVLSRTSNAFARTVLGIDVSDLTAGFRAYRTDLLRQLRLDCVTSEGYCFQIDMTRISADAGARIAEIPIVFRERKLGSSKMTGSIIGEALTKVTGWGVGRRAAQAVSLVRRLR